MKPILTFIIIFVAVFAARQSVEFRGFTFSGDLDGALAMARNWRNPYMFVADVPYPFTAGLAVLPIAWLPDRIAGSVFSAFSSALLAGVMVARTGQPWRLMMFLSMPYWHALEWAQWSPLVAAAWFAPVLAPLVFTLKPQSTLAVLFSRGVHIGGLALAICVLAVSFAVRPTWFGEWISHTGHYSFVLPVLAPGGLAMLMCLARINSARARLLLGMAFTPQRGAYDLVTLFLLPTSPLTMLMMVIASWAVPFYVLFLVGAVWCMA